MFEWAVPANLRVGSWWPSDRDPGAHLRQLIGSVVDVID
jgi:hypothetical protein